MNLLLPNWYKTCYEESEKLADKFPYVYGGGHNHTFAASIGLTNGSQGPGYDCSGYTSRIVHKGCPGELPAPLGTHEIEYWGLSGPGEWMTWWVVNGKVNGVFTEHTVLEFNKGVPKNHRFAMAYFTGGPLCGFSEFFDTQSYHSRRRIG